ncbi:DMT family transporter [Heyndrickxia acidicola]|uniref:DMT family transporter n=1 Tax=Heyndrickxia acidicola TaxID=209389 RepID=A0ABU6MN08_9BACI|nr:DMT family transporter [Heyndrickxia acidicola]MED1206080.1 DMT family transporter [Heyndrickxia acidicola]
MKPGLRVYFILFIGVAAVSASAILVKLSTASAGVLAFYRLFLTTLMIAPIIIFKYTLELKMISKRDWYTSIIAGIFLAFHFVFWFQSLNYTSVASSTVLVTLQPLFVFLGTYLFFKEKYSPSAILCGLMAIFGSAVIGWGDFETKRSSFTGDLLALISCAFISIYFMFGQGVRKRVSFLPYTFIVYGISTVVLFIYVLLHQEHFVPYSLNNWIYFILLAVVPTLIGHTILNWSLEWVSSSVISMLILIEPVIASFLALILLGEDMSGKQIIGGLIILSSIAIFIVGGNRKEGKSLLFIRTKKHRKAQ